MASPVLHAFIDEAGNRSVSPRSPDHFLMTAVVVADAHLPAMAAQLAQLRIDLRRRPGDTCTGTTSRAIQPGYMWPGPWVSFRG
jgi:hypothetical protein